MIDRRYAKPAPPPEDIDDIVKDRFKYDHSDDEENPVYELNPYSEELLRFRARLVNPGADHGQHHSHQIHQQVALAARRQQAHAHAQQIAEMAGAPATPTLNVPTTIVTSH